MLRNNNSPHHNTRYRNVYFNKENKFLKIKILRKIFGPIQDNGQWRIKKNREIRSLYLEADVAALVKNRRLSWLGYILRREKQSLIKVTWKELPGPLG